MVELWEDLATTEMRLHLMSELLNIKVGLADIEEFNLDLKGNLKNKIDAKYCEMQESKIIKAALKLKMHDEQITKRKLHNPWTRWQRIQGQNLKTKHQTYENCLKLHSFLRRFVFERTAAIAWGRDGRQLPLISLARLGQKVPG